MEKIRYIVGGVLIVFILAMSVIFIMNKDTFFQSKIKIVYPDGCTEHYNDTELISPECTIGRSLLEEQNNRGMQWITTNNTNKTNLII
jgi:hypothetical protein